MAETQEKLCKHHGLTMGRYEGVGVNRRLRCRECGKAAVVKRRKKLKQLAIKYMGGGCNHCGYSKCTSALEFHHKDPAKKDFGISYRGNTASFDKIKKELDKCIMLCSNCHREEHERLKT